MDPATNVAGYGLIEQAPSSNTPNYLECGVLKLSAPSREDRLRELWCDATDLVCEYRPHVVVIEFAHFAINPQTALALAEARGVILGVAFSRGIDVASYQPSQAKKVATGRGDASKELVRTHMVRMFGLLSEPELDATDALALAVAHLVLGRRRR